MSVIKRFPQARTITHEDVEQVVEKMEELSLAIRRKLLEGADSRELGLELAACLQSYLLIQKTLDRLPVIAKRAA